MIVYPKYILLREAFNCIFQVNGTVAHSAAGKGTTDLTFQGAPKCTE